MRDRQETKKEGQENIIYPKETVGNNLSCMEMIGTRKRIGTERLT